MIESPGKILRKERESRSIPLEKICAFTKIKEHYLKAIEEERYDLLPHSLYVKGYLKSYSRYLSLDEKTILSLYEDYLKSLLPPEPLTQPEEDAPLPALPKRKRFLLASIFVAVLALSITFLATYLLSTPPEVELTPSPFFSVAPATAIQREEETLPIEESESMPLKQVMAEEEIQPGPTFEILEAGLGTEIDKENERQVLTGNASTFHSNHQRGYFFTRFKTSEVKRIAHVWLFEGKEYHRIEMEVKPPAWSVFSYLTFRPQHIGNWKAEARDGDQVLTSLNFKVLQ